MAWWRWIEREEEDDGRDGGLEVLGVEEVEWMKRDREKEDEALVVGW